MIGVRPHIEVLSESRFKAQVVLEPLERGFGITVGNALRRVLLSSIEGAAVTAVKIDGVVHDFSTVEGVKEDVIDILMNLKKLAVVYYGEGVRVLRLEAIGPKIVTADDIQADSQVEFVRGDIPICTLSEGARVAMELYIERGRGYAATDGPKPQYLPIDALPLDAIFCPVHNVKYVVQDARVGQMTDYDRLVMDIETNGVVAPVDAVTFAADILEDYFRMFGSLKKIPKADILGETVDEVDSSNVPTGGIFGKPIKDLDLSVRSENCLLRGGIRTVGELISKPREEILKIRNLGRVSLREIEAQLQKHSLSLKSNGEPIDAFDSEAPEDVKEE